MRGRAVVKAIAARRTSAAPRYSEDVDTASEGATIAGETPSVRIVDVRRDGDFSTLRRAYEEIYLPAFPVADERESLSEWESSLRAADAKQPRPRRIVLIACDPEGSPLGLVVGEHYRRSRCGLISYIAVGERARRTGVGRLLMSDIVAALRDSERARLEAVFAEVHDPMRITQPDSVDPVARLRFMCNCGAKVLPVRYVQPALSEESERVHSLWLMAFPVAGELGNMIDSAPVREFLTELYTALDVRKPKRDVDLSKIKHDLRGPTTELLKLDFRQEAPVLEFDTYAVAVHVVLGRDPGAPPLPPVSVHMDSFEQDMLSYAYRATPPLRTVLIRTPDEMRPVEVVLPPAVSYRAEGRQVVLSPGAGQSLRRKLRVRVARTDFAHSGLAVLHVIFSPGSVLNEYDLVKLTKIWEGGEGLPRPGERQGWLTFKAGDTDPIPFIDLVERLTENRPFARFGESDVTFPVESDVTFRVGTIQLLTDGGSSDVLSDLCRFREDPTAFAASPSGEKSPARLRLEGLGGIMQGLLDFYEIDELELADVFSEYGGYGKYPLGFHKGTLLHVAPADRAWESTRDYLGISPYLLVTHGVLVHNEERLMEAHRLAAQLSGPWPRRRSSAQLAHGWRRIRPVVGQLRRTRADMVTALSQMVPNVMHYEQERTIYETGLRVRGLKDLEAEVNSELARAAISIDARINNSLTLAGALVGIVVAVITATSFFLPKWLVPVLIVVIAVGFFAFFKVRERRSPKTDLSRSPF